MSRRVRYLMLLTLCLMVCGRPAAAGEHLSGIVLMMPSAQQIVIHHSAFAGMPSMTMTFNVPLQTRVHPGDRIDADVDRSTDPWTLSNIRVSPSEASVPAPPAPVFLHRGDRVPNVAFVDQAGRPFSFATLHVPYALTFVYTRCVDATMCPLISAKYRALQQRSKKRFALVEISLDPAYDRPPVLARYAAAYGADSNRWHVLTGNPRSVLDFAAQFGILERSAGPVTIVHSERLAIVDPSGRIARFFDYAAWSPNDVFGALQRASNHAGKITARSGAYAPPRGALMGAAEILPTEAPRL